jgi:uncharacterized membrane protein YbhN (UPF0104 family)
VHPYGTLVLAADLFLHRLAPASWAALALALLLDLARLACATRAWRNIVAAAYPEARVPWRGVFGATVAGMAVSTFVPAKGGELLRLYLVRRQVPGASYATLAATLVVETVFPFVVAAGFLVAAVQVGAVPGLSLVPDVSPGSWIAAHPIASALLAAALLGTIALVAVLAGDRIGALLRRVAKGFAALGDWRVYLRRVALWQALDWTLRLVALYWFLRAFGLVPSFHNAFAVQVAQNTSALVPLTPSGIGTEQALVVSNLAGDLPAGEALGFSVGMKLALTAANAVLGFGALVLMARTLRWRRLLAGEAPGPGERGGADPV